jgi:hypothetical protein
MAAAICAALSIAAYESSVRRAVPADVRVAQFGDMTKVRATPQAQRTPDGSNQGERRNDAQRPANPFGPITK